MWTDQNRLADPERLVGPTVLLRKFQQADAEDVAAACSDPLIQRFGSSMPSPYTLADGQWWVTEGAPQTFARDGAAYAIVDPINDRLIGGAGFTRGRWATAEVGYWIAPWARLAGAATAATRLLASHLFATSTRRISLLTHPANVASQRVAIAAGFAWEGIRRSAAQDRTGNREDRVVWVRLHTDPGEPSRRLLPDLPGRRVLDGRVEPGHLSDGVVTLRPLDESAAHDTYALRALPEVVATNVPPQQPDRDQIFETCARAPGEWLAGHRADFTIHDAASDAYAGEIGLYYWEPPTQQAMIGYSIAREWRRHGFATRAAALVRDWAFASTDIKRIIAGTAPDNTGSQSVLEGAGFVREGYQRSRLPGANGTRIDDILYAVLPPDSPSSTGAKLITP